MSESNTRKYWRTRMTGFIKDTERQYAEGMGPDIEGWLNDWMQTPEFSLAELTDSNPNYRLAVADTSDGDDRYDGEAYAKGEVRVISRYRVVKMEDK